MKLKKILGILLVLVAIFVFVGCGKDNPYELTDWYSMETEVINGDTFETFINLGFTNDRLNFSYHREKKIYNNDDSYYFEPIETKDVRAIYWIETIPNLNVRIIDNGKVIEDTVVAEIDGDNMNFTYSGKTYVLSQHNF